MRLTRRLTVVSLFLALAILASCGGEAEPKPVPEVIPPTVAPTEPPTSTPEPTAAPTEVPTAVPTAVPASVSGRVLWNGQPVPGARVALVTEDEGQVVASAEAGAAGQFLLAAVAPGTYDLVTLWPDGTENPGASLELVLEPGQAVNNLALTLERALVLLEPDTENAPTLPSIVWEPLPEATQYHVMISASDATERVIDTVVTGDRLDVVDQLDVSTAYGLVVLATDEAGTPLARYTGEMQTGETATPPRAVILPAVCRQTGLPTYIDRAQGLCFAYPQDHTMLTDVSPPAIAGPPVAAGAIFFPGLSVQTLPAEGLELAEWVDRYLSEMTDTPDEVDRVPTTVAGQAAEILEPIPGEVSSRQVAIASGANVHLLTFTPTFRHVPAEEQDFIQRRAQIAADNLFETVMATLAFLPAATANAVGDIELPAACVVDGMGLNVDVDSGLCVAVPTGFTAQRTPDGLPRLIGPALDEGLSPMRATFAVLPIEAAEGRTLDEIVTDYVATAGGDATTQSEVMIGGQPAVLIENLPAGRGSQEIFVLHHDEVYHLVFQPDPDVIPLAEGDMARLLSAVTESFSFLETDE